MIKIQILADLFIYHYQQTYFIEDFDFFKIVLSLFYF